MMIQYYVLKDGEIVQGVMTGKDREWLQGQYPGHEVKTEDELPDDVLSRYEFWSQRP